MKEETQTLWLLFFRELGLFAFLCAGGVLSLWIENQFMRLASREQEAGLGWNMNLLRFAVYTAFEYLLTFVMLGFALTVVVRYTTP